MKIFSYLYDKILLWSRHRHAQYYLASVSFVESSFFPIPPDVMLISMGLAEPRRSWRHALIATIFSVLGGLFGYLIGLYGIELIEPYLISSSYATSYYQIMGWFEHYGVWIIFIAGFTPLPYKIFTITAGAMQMPILPFLIGSLLGRGMRFFMVSGVLYFAGERIQPKLRKFVDIIGWSTLLVALIVFFLVKLLC